MNSSVQAPETANYYVAPNGSSSGDGSIGRPWNLQTALDGPSSVRPGDTIWLRGGTYVGSFTSYLQGTSSAPIIVRQYPGERAVLDRQGYHCNNPAPLSIYGGYTWYWDFEVMNSDTNRIDTTGGCRGVGVNVQAPNTKFINMVVHDNDQGFGFWTEAPDSEIYGSLVYNNGIVDPNERGGRGHGIYVQNDTGNKVIKDNIIFNQFDYGIHAYAQNGQLHNLDIEGNTSFNNGLPDDTDNGHGSAGILVGGTTYAVTGLTVSNNYLYMYPTMDATNLQLGYDNAVHDQDLNMRNNYVARGYTTRIKGFQSMTVSGNTFYGTSVIQDLDPRGMSTSGYNWNNNSYFGGGSTPFKFNGQSYALGGWRSSTGLDTSSTYSNGRPAGTSVFIRPNQYESGRANITIFNWGLAPSVSVDLSGVLSAGDQYQVRNAQDFLAAPVASGTYAGGSVSLTMAGLSAAAPIGWPATPLTGPEFNVFVVMKVAGPGTPVATNSPVPTNPPPATNTPTRTRTPAPTQTPGGPTATNTPIPTRTRTPAPTQTPLPTQTPGGPTATDTPISACLFNFADVYTNDYFYEAVRSLYCDGIVSGYSNNTFRPYNLTTRGQLSKIIVLGSGWAINTTGGPHFSDVPASNTFYDYIETAYHMDVISGYADGTFRWNANINRGQLCKVVVLAAGWSLINPGTPSFDDVPTRDTFYRYVETAYDHAVISGYADGTFRPYTPAIRGQICKIVYNALQSGQQAFVR
ncbi:MAG: S-layer homology domain-containing protein [Chloroflexia bacterium]